VNPGSANVRAIRPMRILLVTDDGPYADEVASAASLRGVDLALAGVDDDLEATATSHAPNVVVLDADDKIARTSRAATVFAALHPRIATVIVARRAPERIVGSVQVVDKRRSADNLLADLENALLGLAAPVEADRCAGD
jgi:ActR/RegA family two-component response regulator